MGAFDQSTFEKMFAAAKLCRERGLDVPCLVLVYSTMDALAWAAYGESIPDTRRRFTHFCDELILPNGELGCTSVELYAARCSIVHSLGWASTLSESGKARSAFYSFGKDDPTAALAALEHTRPGQFFAIRGDNLIASVEAAYNTIQQRATSDKELASRLRHAEGKQYRPLESEAGDKFFLEYLRVVAGRKS